ncbi:MAG TPA: HAD family hydrolase [Planctomycetota bacterium]|nr:HAD family hydrolase [Planctomycetota bacterium]
MSKHPLALITFDIDDTLYASTDFARLARENALKAMIATGLNVSLDQAAAELDEIVAEFTSNDEKQFDRLLERLPKSCSCDFNAAVLVAIGVAAYHDTIHESFMPYEDGVEAFKRLHARGFALGVATQGKTIKQAEKIARLRILPFLHKRAIFFSDQLGISKSSPKFFRRAAEMFGADPRTCMHIGDRPDRDIDPPNTAGWLTVLNRRSGRYHARPGATPPAHEIQNFWDFIELIEKGYEPKEPK